MISTRSVGLLIDTVVCLTLAKWETVSGRFGGYLMMTPLLILNATILLEKSMILVGRPTPIRMRLPFCSGHDPLDPKLYSRPIKVVTGLLRQHERRTLSLTSPS